MAFLVAHKHLLVSTTSIPWYRHGLGFRTQGFDLFEEAVVLFAFALGERGVALQGAEDAEVEFFVGHSGTLPPGR